MAKPVIIVKTSTTPQKTVFDSSIDTTRVIGSAVITSAPVIQDFTGISITAGKQLFLWVATEGVRQVNILNKTSTGFRVQVEPDSRYPSASGKVYVFWGEF